MSAPQHPASSAVGRRISVVGTCGSGKTRIAKHLASGLGLAFVELDALFWKPNWTPSSDDEFRPRVVQAVAGDAWVIDGNYGRTRDLVWARADTVVWLDYSFFRVLWQLVRRTIRRGISRETLWNGNRERLCVSFLSRESILLWAITTYGRRKRQYSELLGRPECAHLRAIRLRCPRETEKWLRALGISP